MPPPLLFNRLLVRMHRERAAARFAQHDFLHREMADRLADRLCDITRRFPLALDLGCRTGALASLLKGRGGVKTLVQADLSQRMASRTDGLRLACDEEFLPFAPDVFDLVIAAGSLQWVNDVPGALVQIRHVLKPGGLLLAMVPGGETLKELREAMTDACLREEGGIAPRISPFIDVRDAGALLQRAGFKLPVADSERLRVSYGDPFALMHDLRHMGETNALLHGPKHFTRRNTLTAIASTYQRLHADEGGRIPATFELVTMTGWKE